MVGLARGKFSSLCGNPSRDFFNHSCQKHWMMHSEDEKGFDFLRLSYSLGITLPFSLSPSVSISLPFFSLSLFLNNAKKLNHAVLQSDESMHENFDFCRWATCMEPTLQLCSRPERTFKVDENIFIYSKRFVRYVGYSWRCNSRP
jgi:hypothetical protein